MLPRPEGAAAVCPPGDGEEEGAATAFVLLPMLRAALLSTVSSAPSVSVSASADETNRLLEAGAATGSAEELSRLRRAGNVRVLRLHGTRAEGGEEDLAAMESPDYCRAVRDAFALGRRMEASMAARREVQTQVQQQAQEEGAIDWLGRWYLFHLAAWARTYVTRADLCRALPPSASAGLLHRPQHHHRLPSPPPPPAVAVPPVDRIADRLVAIGLLLTRSGEGRSGCVGPKDDGRGHHWLAERRKGDLIVKRHLKAKSGHPWLAERCIEDLVVKCHLKATSGPPSVVKAPSSLGVTRPQRAAILGLRNVVKATWSSSVA